MENVISCQDRRVRPQRYKCRYKDCDSWLCLARKSVRDPTKRLKGQLCMIVRYVNDTLLVFDLPIP